MQRPRIGVDLMGGDEPPSAFLDAIFGLKDELKDTVHLVIFGSKDICAQVETRDDPTLSSRIASGVIEMDDNPLTAIRTKKQASMPLGLKALSSGEIDAFVTTGNTGALIAASQLFLTNLGGIERPALLTSLPTKRGIMAVLDVGANVTSTPEQLLQFAKMGIAYQLSSQIKAPKVGLLNIGVETHKGTPLQKKAFDLFSKELGPSFLGNIEGHEAFDGNVDVLVTDGFTGNVFLKTAEGVSTLHLSKLASFAPKSAGDLKRLLHDADTAGALLAGVGGIVIKCHGNAHPLALANGIKKAHSLIEGSFLQKIKDTLPKV